MNSATCVLESQVDWLTLTRSRADGISDLLRLGYELILGQTQNGNIAKPFLWKGYTGAHCGPVSYGDRDDGALLQITGAAANGLFGQTLSAKPKCTRIDLQVTARLEHTGAGYASSAYREVQAAPLSRGTRPKTTLYQNSDGGETCYVGAPSSIHRGRVYDKHKESGNDYYEHCWRWEVESRQEAADSLYSQLASHQDIPSAIAGYVVHWFTERGVVVPFSAESLFSLTLAPADRTDVEHKLRWLEQQVRPTVKELCLLGYEDRVRLALGLNPYTDTYPHG